MYIADCVYIPIVGLKTVDLGLASDFFHAERYTAYANKSMKHLCSFRTLTLLSAAVFKIRCHD